MMRQRSATILNYPRPSATFQRGVPGTDAVIIVLASRTVDYGRSILRLPSDIIVARISSAMIKPCWYTPSLASSSF